MKPLEETLKEILELRKDLDATIFHEEIIIIEPPPAVCGPGWYTPKDGKICFHAPGWTEPDTKKRETARNILQEIVDSSEWHSARYLAEIYMKECDRYAPERLSASAEAKMELAHSKKARKLLKRVYADKNASAKNFYRCIGDMIGYSPARMRLQEIPHELHHKIENCFKGYCKPLTREIVDTIANYFCRGGCHMSRKTKNAISYTLMTAGAVVACGAAGLMAAMGYQGKEGCHGIAYLWLTAALIGGIDLIIVGKEKVEHANESLGRR